MKTYHISIHSVNSIDGGISSNVHMIFEEDKNKAFKKIKEQIKGFLTDILNIINFERMTEEEKNEIIESFQNYNLVDDEKFNINLEKLSEDILIEKIVEKLVLRENYDYELGSNSLYSKFTIFMSNISLEKNMELESELYIGS